MGQIRGKRWLIRIHQSRYHAASICKRLSNLWRAAGQVFPGATVRPSRWRAVVEAPLAFPGPGSRRPRAGAPSPTRSPRLAPVPPRPPSWAACLLWVFDKGGWARGGCAGVPVPSGDVAEAHGEVADPWERVRDLYGGVADIYGELADISGVVGELYGEVADISGAVGDLYGGVADITGAVGELYGGVADITGVVAEVYGRVADLFRRQAKRFEPARGVPVCAGMTGSNSTWSSSRRRPGPSGCW